MHTIDYTVVEHYDPVRRVEVHATPEEIQFFADFGYLVRPGLLSDKLEDLRQGLELVSAREASEVAISTGVDFGGRFLRHLMEKHPAFLDLFRCEPLLSVARAMLGPMVQVLPMTARIAYPGEANQQTEWHIHQRVIPDPLPAFFSQPHVIDVLIYLDDVDEASGPVSVVPGSHKRVHTPIPVRHEAMEGELKLYPRAGDAVMIHGNTWHRAHPTKPEGHIRRMLIQPYAASWLKLPSYGDRPTNGLMKPLYENPDRETRELLGIAEGLY